MYKFVFIILLVISTCLAYADQVDDLKLSTDRIVNKIVNSNQVYIGIAAEMKGGPFYSQFGHAFLVFANSNENSDDYLVLNLEAKIDGQKLKQAFFLKRYFTYLKASIPVVDIVLTFQTLAEKKILDNELGQRNIQFNQVKLKYKDLDNIKIQLLKDIDQPKRIGKYSFFSNNCTGAIHKLFKQAGINFEKTIFPTHLKEQLLKSGFELGDDLVIPNSSEYKNNSILPLIQKLGLTVDQIEKSITLSQIEILKIIEVPELYYYFYKNDYFRLDEQTRSQLDQFFLDKYPDIDLSYFEKI